MIDAWVYSKHWDCIYVPRIELGSQRSWFADFQKKKPFKTTISDNSTKRMYTKKLHVEPNDGPIVTVLQIHLNSFKQPYVAHRQ